MKIYTSIFFLFFSLVGCGDRNSQLRGEFLAGCINSGGTQAICACAFEKVERQYGDQIENVAPDKLISSIVQFGLACRNEQTSSNATDQIKAALNQPSTSPNPALPNEPKASDSTVLQDLNKAIAEQINIRTQYGGGSEYREARKIIETDLNGDKSPDAIVLYTIEGAGGGNSAIQTLALFFGNQGNYFAQGTIPVSGASDIALNSSGDILVTTLTHGPDDPDCCPSMKSSQVYHVDGDQLMIIP